MYQLLQLPPLARHLRAASLLALFLLASLALGGQASAQNWAPFGTSENGDAITLDRDSIVKGGESAGFTMRVDFNSPMTMDGQPVTHMTVPIEIDCVETRYRRAAEEFRNPTGTLVVANKATAWIPLSKSAPQGSFPAALLRFCQ